MYIIYLIMFEVFIRLKKLLAIELNGNHLHKVHRQPRTYVSGDCCHLTAVSLPYCTYTLFHYDLKSDHDSIQIWYICMYPHMQGIELRIYMCRLTGDWPHGRESAKSVVVERA